MSTRPAPIGSVGCMWVGGVGVSGGYLNMEEKTRERWRPDPFVGPPLHDADSRDQYEKKPNGEWARPMMFNTGDLGRWRKDGQLEHMGRADDQVKVKGFRVELDGVAMAMRVRFFHTLHFLCVSSLLPQDVLTSAQCGCSSHQQRPLGLCHPGQPISPRSSRRHCPFTTFICRSCSRSFHGAGKVPYDTEWES